MDLIIKIPDEQYNDIVKHLTDNDGNYAYSDFNLREIIRNGTPYNPAGDLISREALKESFAEECCGCCDNCSHCMTGYKCGLIDNAQTVEISGLPKIHYDRGFIAGYEKGKAERPTGEWHIDESGVRWCKFCGASESSVWKNFCHNCGADMRKGAKNEKSDK